MFRRLPLALLAAALACSLTTLPAQAQRARVFVASYGTDSGNTLCSFTQPCRTFQNAVSHVAVGGEVAAIDSAGFGPISITQSVTITSPNGVEAGVVTTAGTDAIDISGTSVTVVLRGLTLEGNGTANNGVNFSAGGELQIVGCKIRNFAAEGVNVQASGATSVLIKDSLISDNNDYGIELVSDTASATITAALDEVTVNNNIRGIIIFANNAPIEAQITNSHIDNSQNGGIVMQGGNVTALANAILKHVTINQTPTGFSLAGDTRLWLSYVTQSTVTGFSSNAGILFTSSNNTASSDGTSHIMGGLSGGSLSAWTPQ
jgi:Right handed beta helix region